MASQPEGAPDAGRIADQGALRRSVVKIFVRSVAPNWTSPWQTRPQTSSTGSGLCIDCAARQVLTNAHVVRDAVAVRVRRYGDAVRYPARVLCISPQCDLALLHVADDGFWDGIGAIQMTEEVPSLDCDVLTVGYPMGGDNICVTRGVVSRIDLMDYTFSPGGGERLPVIQVDAAINPGNSGGPVLGVTGQAVGVAFAGLKQGENIGYVIPSTVVQFFLRGYRKTGTFAGLCSLGIRVQQAQSAALRRLHGLSAQGLGGAGGEAGVSCNGVLIVDVAPLSAAAAAGLTAGDALLSVDGISVAEDASVPFRGAGSGERIGFDYLVTQKVVGEEIELAVMKALATQQKERDGEQNTAGTLPEIKTLDVRAEPLRKLVPRTAAVDATPSYFVVGGLVFVTLTQPWLLERFGRDVRKAPSELQEKLNQHKAHADEEVVILSKVLAAEVNYGYEDFQCLQLQEFGTHNSDGAEADATVVIQGLRHLRELVRAALLRSDASRPMFLCFRMANDLEVVLESGACLAAQEDILRLHGIPNDSSADLLDTLDTVGCPTSRL